MPDQLRPRIFDRIERKFDLMQELGANLLLVCSNVSPAALGDRKRIVNDFRELGERAAKRDLRVGYEALAWGRHVYDHRDAWSIVRDIDHSSVGLILDSFHSLARNDSDRESSAKSIRNASSSFNSPMHRCARWTTSRGAGICVTCRGRATCRSWNSSLRCSNEGTTDFCHSKSSTIDFASTPASTVAVDGHRVADVSLRPGRAQSGSDQDA